MKKAKKKLTKPELRQRQKKSLKEFRERQKRLIESGKEKLENKEQLTDKEKDAMNRKAKHNENNKKKQKKYNDISNQKRKLENIAFGLKQLEATNGTAFVKNLEVYKNNPKGLEELFQRFVLYMMMGYYDRGRWLDARRSGDSSAVQWEAIRTFDKKYYGGVDNIFLSRDIPNVNVIFHEIETVFAPFIEAFRRNLEESMDEMEDAIDDIKRGDGCFADMLRLNCLGHYVGETKQVLDNEVYRWATQPCGSNPPNITWTAGRRITFSEMRGTLRFLDIFGPTFPQRVYSRLFENAWHQVTVAYLSVFLPDENVIHGLTLWKAPGCGAYKHGHDAGCVSFYSFITYSPFVYKWLHGDEADRQLEFHSRRVT